MIPELPTPLVMYDGECKFCHWSTEFILKHESSASLNFTWLQGEMGKNLIEQYKVPASLDSILFLDETGLYTKSQAAFRIASYLKPPYQWIRLFSILPYSWSDAVYDFIARHRKKIMGSTTSCVLPSTDSYRFY
jgi:predicted DCC family thiol-disulfide oxidoreductase YuxK